MVLIFGDFAGRFNVQNVQAGLEFFCFELQITFRIVGNGFKTFSIDIIRIILHWTETIGCLNIHEITGGFDRRQLNFLNSQISLANAPAHQGLKHEEGRL